MKNPLGYQVTKFDCGPTSIINAISFLFAREDIPFNVLKIVYEYSLDEGYHGTSTSAIEKIINTFNNYITDSFKLTSIILKGEEVTLDKMKECISNKGCILIRCYHSGEHYSLITNMDNTYAYIFDPYYLKPNFISKDHDLEIVVNQQLIYNRIVKISRLMEENNLDFSLMRKKDRFIVLFRNL